MKRFRVFPGIIFVLLGMNMAIVGYTVYAANSDGGAAIEPDYYRKALAHDSIRQQQQDTAALGWQYRVLVADDAEAGTSVLRAEVRDRDGLAITGATIRAVAFPNIRANQRHQMLLLESDAGVYSAPLQITHAGQWHVEISIESRGRTVQHQTDVLILEHP